MLYSGYGEIHWDQAASWSIKNGMTSIYNWKYALWKGVIDLS
jgi:hypothetical protein